MDDEALIQTIDSFYYENEEDFKLDNITKQLPADLTTDYLLEYKWSLERLLLAVTRKVSELVQNHQPTYVDELQNIANLQKSVTECINVCGQGRSCLRVLKNGSNIFDLYRRRETMIKLLNSLSNISYVNNHINEIKAMVDSGEDYHRKVQLCKNAKALLANFQEFNCINELSSSFKDYYRALQLKKIRRIIFE